ncbi:alpha/beta fold hydrolase [Paenibacillus arenilitoris]|uniref:Alpha/beta fold hydrolase n=1 Tax=Paenibacillus arenilitoris TaxID=2772299 RepID=A0A927CPQ1_9BACL|nr:alpha/beta fold hydrolase [Paenibacillus arenilitoris]MBD2869991.1 alpha/beta fold hydrolase [Paenibacillus arenilitoris]
MNAGKGTILWLTGWSFAASLFDPLREQLPEWRHAAAPYHDADAPERFLELAAQAARSIREAGEGRLLVAGWSLGGLSALRLAAEEEVDGLVLLSATAKFVRAIEEGKLGWPERHVRRMDAELHRNREAAEERFRGTLLTDEERASGYDALLPPSGGWTAGALAAGLELLRQEDCRALLGAVACPALVVHGSLDTVCPIGAADELVQSLPRAAPHIMDKSGHVPFLGREKEFGETIRRWWNERQLERD